MSRLGKIPIKLSSDVQARLENNYIIIKGSKGELKQKLHDFIVLELKNDEIIVNVKNPQTQQQKAFWGLYRSLINNMVEGVKNGFEKKLEINGVGYKALVNGKKITLNLGFSHPIEMEMPFDIDVKVEANIITISGYDKQKVGEIAAQIRKLKKPEPYKGKGIKYIDEQIIRKAGKSASKSD